MRTQKQVYRNLYVMTGMQTAFLQNDWSDMIPSWFETPPKQQIKTTQKKRQLRHSPFAKFTPALCWLKIALNCTMNTGTCRFQKLHIPGHFVNPGKTDCPINMSARYTWVVFRADPHQSWGMKAEVLKQPKPTLILLPSWMSSAVICGQCTLLLW